MKMFTRIVSRSRIILTEGGVVERIKRNPDVILDPYVAHAGLIYDEMGRKVLKEIYNGYIDAARDAGVPMITLAPTWRANPDRLKQSVFKDRTGINQDGVAFLKGIRKEYGDYADQIFIGGMMACKGDAYQPGQALSPEDAGCFHAWQAERLAQSGVDFIKAATLPAVSEAYGIASAIAALDIPYVLSFVVRPDGAILDGTPVHKAIELIDTKIDPAPVFYMINCVHPTVFDQAMDTAVNRSSDSTARIWGLQANTSTKSPEALDNLSYVDTTEPAFFANLMMSMHKKHGIKVLGGCCGSDNSHMTAISRKIVRL